MVVMMKGCWDVRTMMKLGEVIMSYQGMNCVIVERRRWRRWRRWRRRRRRRRKTMMMKMRDVAGDERDGFVDVMREGHYQRLLCRQYYHRLHCAVKNVMMKMVLCRRLVWQHYG